MPESDARWISDLHFDGTFWKRLMQHGPRQIMIMWGSRQPPVDADPGPYAARAAKGKTWYHEGDY